MFTLRGFIESIASPFAQAVHGGGGASLPPNPTPAHQFQNLPKADAGAMTAFGGLNSNPTGSYNAGASTAGGSALTQTAGGTLPYVNQALQTAFDPQSALYARAFQQQQDQGNVTNAQNGVAGTPYGAALARQGNQNFDIDWQKAQIQNQQTGAGTAATLLGGAGSGLQTGTSVGQAVPSFNNSQMSQIIQDYLAYLNGGTNASNAATGQYSAQAGAAIDNQKLTNQADAGLGQLGGDLLGMFLA